MAGSGADEQSPMNWGRLRSPRWIASHLAVLALVTAMVIAGLWQIDRHGERADRNDTIRARSELAPVDIATIAAPGEPTSVGTDEQYTRVVVLGEYRLEDEVLIRNRTQDGAPGWWVLTPLVTDQGWGVAVNRGWIPTAFDDDQARPGTEPPSGNVEVVGTIQPTREAEGFQVADPEDGVLASLARPDVQRLAAQLDYELSPVVLQLPEGANGTALPFGLPLPPLDAGPHASYAAQWFIFTTIALVGYPIVLRRVARGRAESLPTDP